MSHCLKPCPFCGSEPTIGLTLRDNKPHRHSVACSVCPMATPWRETREEVKEIWNRRPPTQGSAP